MARLQDTDNFSDLIDTITGPSDFQRKYGQLWQQNDNHIRCWAAAAIDSERELCRFYRFWGEDMDSDLARAAEYFGCARFVSPEPIERASSILHLRLMRRVLMRNYAFVEALRVNHFLSEWEPSWIWRVWRVKDLFLPRLALAILAGFLLLSSSSLLVESLLTATHTLLFPILSMVSAAIVFLLAASDVQRRLGRRPWSIILGRAAIVWIIGIIQAAIGGLVVFWLGSLLYLRPEPRHIMLCSTSALVMGFVFQLFWQERSIADPL